MVQMNTRINLVGPSKSCLLNRQSLFLFDVFHCITAFRKTQRSNNNTEVPIPICKNLTEGILN